MPPPCRCVFVYPHSLLPRCRGPPISLSFSKFRLIGGKNAQQFPHEESVENTVLHKLEVDKLHTALAMLTPEEQALIQALFFEEKTERQYAEELGVYRNAIHVRKTRILKKLKNFWNNVVQTSHRTLKTAYPFIKHIPASLAKAKARTAAAR